MSDIRYASIRSMDISNGEGIGVALFVQGCSFHCNNCFNPETWDFNRGIEWNEDIEDIFLNLAEKEYVKRISILGGDPLMEENLDGILKLIEKVKKMYNSSKNGSENPRKQGVFEPINSNERAISTPGKSIWIYSGYTWKEIFEEPKIVIDSHAHECFEKRRKIISQCDVFVDGRYIDSKRDITLKWRGSSNQRAIDVKESLRNGEVVLWCD